MVMRHKNGRCTPTTVQLEANQAIRSQKPNHRGCATSKVQDLGEPLAKV